MRSGQARIGQRRYHAGIGVKDFFKLADDVRQIIRCIITGYAQRLGQHFIPVPHRDPISAHKRLLQFLVGSFKRKH